MLNKVSLYLNTLRYMKFSQVMNRVVRTLHLPCELPTNHHAWSLNDEVHPIENIPTLDFDDVFLARFSVDEVMQNRLTFLHESCDVEWNGKWNYDGFTPLWNFNLHYFEWLFPLVKKYRDKTDSRYVAKLKESILGWIANNEKGTGSGWAPYTIALRTVNWLNAYGYLQAELDADTDFRNLFLSSLYEQYQYLAHNLEKDLLGNHYFADLKALILCAVFFNDSSALPVYVKEFQKQCGEQILPDGVHFELSPMYHKIILEDLLRVAVALNHTEYASMEYAKYVQSMIDATFSLENGLNRTPLFNDSGDNVAKSTKSLLLAANRHFGLNPRYRAVFPDSGYYIFKQGPWTLIVDAGQPGATYIPGHSHCDAGSFELFRSGEPIIVNCGTYAYQCEERNFYRSTAAHNTVVLDGIEQSQYWGVFRLAKRAFVEVISVDDTKICMNIRNQKGKVVTRTIELLADRLSITDKANGQLSSWLHFAEFLPYYSDAKEYEGVHPYAPEYGKNVLSPMVRFENDDKVCISIDLR